MAYIFNDLLTTAGSSTLDDMPPISIDLRTTDKKVLYNKNLTRLDRLAGDIYDDETLWKIILWANPDYDCEFDIPDNTVIRIPFPIRDVLSDVTSKILTTKDLG